MTLDQQRRLVALGSRIVRIEGRIEEAERGLISLSGILHCLDAREVLRQLGIVGYGRGLLEDLRLACTQIEQYKTRRRCARSRAEHDPVSVGPQRGEIGVGQVDRRQGFRTHVDDRGTLQPLQRVGAHQTSGTGTCVGGQSEDPLGLAEFSVHGRERLAFGRRQFMAIQVPPAATVGDRGEERLTVPAPIFPAETQIPFLRLRSPPVRRRHPVRPHRAWCPPTASGDDPRQGTRLLPASGDKRVEE